MPQKIGELTQRVIDLLALPYCEGSPIFLGKTNVEHMKRSHPEAYGTYGKHIETIVQFPDYVALHKNNGSIEYVKGFNIDGNFVKVAVRASGQN